MAQAAPNGNEVLAAGRYYWQPDRAPVGRINIVINLRSQMAYVYRGGVVIGETNISSGRDGFDTPVGRYTIRGKVADYRSRKYDAAMPFTQWVIPEEGIALHAGSTPGRPVSHGCIHLPPVFAELLFGQTRSGDTVTITNDEPTLDIDLG